MRTALLTILLLSAGLTFLPDFAANVSAQEPATTEDTADMDTDSDPVADLATAKRDLTVAHLRMENILSEQELTRLQTEMAHTNAVADLQEYNVFRKEASLQQAVLDLQYAKDELADAEEELRQLGMMYDMNHLADATAQIVMERAQRGIERQRKALELAQKEHANWIKFDLPRELRQLKNTEAIAAAEVNLMFLAQTLELKEMEIELADLKKNIEELEKGMQESGD